MMEHTTGEGETTAAGGTLRSGMHLHTGEADDRLGSDQAGRSSRTNDYRDRVASGLGEISGRVSALLDNRRNIFEPVRKYPLVAVGVAFTVGLALASSRRPGERHWMVERTRRQLRTLLLGTATAAVVSELHNLAETDERIRTLLGAYLGELPEEDEDFEDYDDDFDEDDDDLPPLR
jgi:hypothetical protein